MDVGPVLRTIGSVAPQHVEDGQRIEIARMQQLLAERLAQEEERLQTPCLVLDLAPRSG